MARLTATAGKPIRIGVKYDENGKVIEEQFSEPMAKVGGGGGGGGSAGQGDWFVMEAAKNPMMQLAHFGQLAYEDPLDTSSRSMYESMANSFRNAENDKYIAKLEADKATAEARRNSRGGGPGGNSQGSVFGGGAGGDGSGFGGGIPNMGNQPMESDYHRRQQAMKEQLYMLDQQRSRARQDQEYKLKMLKNLMANMGNMDDTETQMTTQYVNHGGRWDPVQVPTTVKRSNKQNLLSMLMGAL